MQSWFKSINVQMRNMLRFKCFLKGGGWEGGMKALVKGGLENRHRKDSLMGWGIAGWDSPSGLFCIVFPFELQIGGRQKCWNVSCGRLHRETSKSRNRKPTEGHYFSEENTDSKAKFKACDLCCSFWTTWIIWLPWCSGKKNSEMSVVYCSREG